MTPLVQTDACERVRGRIDTRLDVFVARRDGVI